MIGASPGLQKVRTLIEQSAASDARILILGENGTGKELVAREIHRRSHRSGGPFVEVNCASIPETLIESELFGHEKGSFTNAVARRKGKFELADGGTLFLDEIADMSLATQAKVLRVIQELKFERVGGEESIAVDVRLIAATNRNIEEEVRAERFREDLYFRINVVPIFVPPLRDRQDDLAELLDYFMKRYRRSPEEAPKSYSWPGNIRELKNFVERVNIMAEEQEISAETVERYLTNRRASEREEPLKDYTSMTLTQAKEELERELVVRKLEEHQGNITQASRALGISPSHLHNKIRKYGIDPKK
jgi:two-component system nitrogen regulation response regulator NtrX